MARNNVRFVDLPWNKAGLLEVNRHKGDFNAFAAVPVRGVFHDS
jgi:hypothetical protein